MFVLVGHHRSGTSFVNSAVRAHPLVESINEPLSQHLDVFRDEDMVAWSPKELSSARLHPSIEPGSPTEDFLLDLKRWLLADEVTEHGFKETCLFEKLEWFEAFVGPMPGALLVRDPRGVVASVLKRDLDQSWWAYRARLSRWIAMHREGAGNVDLADRVAVCAAVWNIRTEIGLRYARAAGWPVVRLEEFFVDHVASLTMLMKELALDVHPQQIAFVEESWAASAGGTYSYRRAPKSVLEEWKAYLSDEDQRTVELHARSSMRELGYL
jgi:hypothetical protein